MPSQPNPARAGRAPEAFGVRAACPESIEPRIRFRNSRAGCKAAQKHLTIGEESSHPWFGGRASGWLGSSRLGRARPQKCRGVEDPRLTSHHQFPTMSYFVFGLFPETVIDGAR